MDKPYLKKNEDQRVEAGNAKAYIEAIKFFLATFKTVPCDQEYQHDYWTCPNSHSEDHRRNPFTKHSFLYFTDLAALKDSRPDADTIDNNMLCLNQTEYLYHPSYYKTQRCQNFYNCPHKLLCPNLHSEDQKNFEYGQFFRFNIDTHKTKHCPRRDHHERKTCIYYHNDLDRRRPLSINYTHELCQPRCKNENCLFSHNKIEQVYHPRRYKTKFCQTYINSAAKCDYKEFCAFAHTQAEIEIEMIDLLPKNHNFYIYKYKTVWCPNTVPHDRYNCVYAHNVQDYRRTPLDYPYLPEKCPFWSFDEELKSIEDSGCQAGMKCDKCHGWMEHRYHPKLYKKGKTDIKQVNSMLDKKLQNGKEKTSQSSRISQVVEEKCNEAIKAIQPSHNVGAPFFKKQVTSDSSRRSKAITTHVESDDSYNKEEPKIQQSDSKKSISIRKKSMFLFSEDQIWRNDEDENNEFEKRLNEERARSENKFDECETVYSHSLKQTVGDSSILKKLKNNNINGVKIKNLSENEIVEFRFLNKQEKDLLTHKIKVYQLRREKNPVIYSLELTKFFIKKKQESILEKSRAKKVKEDQLLAMKSKEIQKLEFLTQEQKDELPILIEQYKKFCNEREFSLINQEIVRFVSPKRNPDS